MSAVRAQVDRGANAVSQQGPGDKVMEQSQVTAITTAGSGVWTAAAILGGIIDRSGPGAGYADTPDTADNIIAACPQLAVGDTLEFMVRNTVAQTNTVAVSSGVALVGGNTTIAASKVRDYQLKCLANKRSVTLQVVTTNGQPTLTGMTAAQAAQIMPGMVVTGTNIAASAYVLAVNINAGTATLSGNSTGTGTVGATFAPSFELKGLRSSDL